MKINPNTQLLSIQEQITLVDELLRKTDAMNTAIRARDDLARIVELREKELEAALRVLDRVLHTEIDWYDGPLFVRQISAVMKTLEEDDV